MDYAVPIERLQAFTSLDFYPNLPDSTEQRWKGSIRTVSGSDNEISGRRHTASEKKNGGRV